MSGAPLWTLPALRQAALVRAGAVSATELVRAHLDRVAATNPMVNAITTTLVDEALAAARAADAAVARGDALGPLHGVPFTIKDNIDVAGSPTTEGVAALAGAVAERDAPAVARLRAAGAIALARTNMPDFGLRVHTESGTHGATVNPWDPALTPGGSSGGEAVALATGMTALGLGSDVGGSLRNPAYCCGVVGLKPGFGRVPNASFPPPALRLASAQHMAAIGPMGRTVADVAAAFAVLAGPHPSDPFSLPLPAPFADDDAARPLRVGVLEAPPGVATDPGVVAAVRRAAGALRAAGHEVRDVVPPRYEEVVDVWRAWLLGEVALILDELAPVMGAGARRFVELTLENWPPTAEPLALTLLSRRHGLARAWSEELFAEVDALLGPVWTAPPFPVGLDVADAAGNRAVGELMSATAPANLLGLPAIAVPAGLSADGRPTGVQVVADRFREDRCLAVATAIEAACGTVTPIDPRPPR